METYSTSVGFDARVRPREGFVPTETKSAISSTTSLLTHANKSSNALAATTSPPSTFPASCISACYAFTTVRMKCPDVRCICMSLFSLAPICRDCFLSAQNATAATSVEYILDNCSSLASLGVVPTDSIAVSHNYSVTFSGLSTNSSGAQRKIIRMNIFNTMQFYFFVEIFIGMGLLTGMIF